MEKRRRRRRRGSRVEDVIIAKVDATANDLPKALNVKVLLPPSLPPSYTLPPSCTLPPSIHPSLLPPSSLPLILVSKAATGLPHADALQGRWFPP
eukprot:754149-Hanusia_phi.AAC.8